MASIQANKKCSRTYEAVEVLDGGQVVEARAGGVSNPGCGIAGTVSLKVIGVAQKAADPAGNAPRAFSGGVLDLTLGPAEVTVLDGNDGFVPVKYGAAAAYGDRLVSHTAGTVKPYTNGTDNPAAIIGWCAESDGVALNATGLIKLTV